MIALDGVAGLLDRQGLAAFVPQGAGSRATGRPQYPVLCRFRALLLGLWDERSDARLSAALARDLLFRKFCRPELDQAAPDDSPPGRFRTRPGDRMEPHLHEVKRAPQDAHVILAEGRIAIGGATAVTPGNHPEVDSLAGLMTGGAVGLYAGAACTGPGTRALPARGGIAGHVQRRGARCQRLRAANKARNAGTGVSRAGVAGVERIFGHFKRCAKGSGPPPAHPLKDQPQMQNPGRKITRARKHRFARVSRKKFGVAG